MRSAVGISRWGEKPNRERGNRTCFFLVDGFAARIGPLVKSAHETGNDDLRPFGLRLPPPAVTVAHQRASESHSPGDSLHAISSGILTCPLFPCQQFHVLVPPTCFRVFPEGRSDCGAVIVGWECPKEVQCDLRFSVSISTRPFRNKY